MSRSSSGGAVLPQQWAALEELGVLDRHINIQDAKGRTALHMLVRLAQGDAFVAEAAVRLFKKKINIIQQDKHGWTALHYACWNNHLEVVDMLIAQHANLDTPTFSKSSKQAAALNNSIITGLSRSKDALRMTEDRATALHIAAKLGHWQIASSLLNASAQVMALSTPSMSGIVLTSRLGDVTAECSGCQRQLPASACFACPN